MHDRTMDDKIIALGTRATRRRALQYLAAAAGSGLAYTAVRESTEAKQSRRKRGRTSFSPQGGPGGRDVGN